MQGGQTRSLLVLQALRVIFALKIHQHVFFRGSYIDIFLHGS
jgi:hypothetical protein